MNSPGGELISKGQGPRRGAPGSTSIWGSRWSWLGLVSGMGSSGPTPWLSGKGKVFSVGEQQHLHRAQTVPPTGKFRDVPGRKKVHWLDSGCQISPVSSLLGK